MLPEVTPLEVVPAPPGPEYVVVSKTVEGSLEDISVQYSLEDVASYVVKGAVPPPTVDKYEVT